VYSYLHALAYGTGRPDAGIFPEFLV